MSDKNRRLGSLRLNFSNCRLSLPKLLDALEGLPCERVEELDASQNDLGDEAPGKILRLLPLRALRLNSAGLSAQGLRSAIEAITQPWLEQDKCREGELSLSSSGLLGSKSPGADGLSLRPSQSLQVLELAACSADAAVPDLALYLASQCCTLTELDLSWNTLGPHAVQELSLHLRQNTTLRSLRLAHCHLKQAAGVLLACLSTSSLPLERLGLARNGMPYSAFEELACFLGSAVGQQLIDLDLSGNKAVAEEPCSRVLGRALCRVQDVESSYASFRGAELKLSLAGTKPFFDAAYGRWDAGPQLLTILRSPGRVLDVNLDHCTFAEAAIPSLARICLNVRNFSLCQCSGGEGTLGQSFAVHLEDLARGLGRRRSERSGGSSIAGALSGIEPEVRGRERQLPLRLLLRELRLNELGLQDGSAQLLSHALAWLRLARRDRADVEVLELEGNHLTHEGVIALADLLENSPLRRLSLSRNKLRPLGGMCMGDLLAARPPQASWLDLELQRCSLGEGVVHLWQQVLSGNARIRRLNLADNAVDAATVEVLLDAAALSPACPEELELLPNPCGSRVVAKLLHHLAPWRTISLKGASPEVAEVAQLLSSFGDQKDATCSRDKPSEFVLSLGNTLKVPPGHWELLGDALKVATCPVTQLPGAARPGTAPFRRLGGCGGILYLEFRDCDLSQAFFRVPRAITPENVELSSIAKSARREWSVKAAERMPSAKSLATRARSAAGEDAVRTPSSRAPFRPAPRVADKCQGATEAPGSEPSSPRSGARCPHRPVPPLRVCREENFTPLFERHEHVDLQASSVLRELRNVQGLRLLQCGLTDGWLAKLGHSGSSKWSGVRMLDLRCNQLTSASSSALASVVSGGLQALVLDGNRLQSVGFKAICTALTGKKCALRWLSVANNDLTHPSGSAAAEVLGSACPLQELSLAMNPKISSGEICTLLRAAARSQAHLYLDLAQTGAAAQVLPFAAKALARCEGLVIDLSGCPAIAEGSAEGPNLERFLADQRLLL